MKSKEEVRRKIEQVGVVPVVRASSSAEALFAAEAVLRGGIPIVEITMTVPNAVKVIAELVRELPDVLTGAGTVLDPEMARECLAAGAEFLVSPGLDLGTVQLAVRERVFMMAGALTPTEVIAAWRAGADFVKIFPCAQVGGASYLKALKGPLPGIPLVPTGGVNLETAASFLRAGAAALGVGGELILKDVIHSRRTGVIEDLSRKYIEIVNKTREEMRAE